MRLHEHTHKHAANGNDARGDTAGVGYRATAAKFNSTLIAEKSFFLSLFITIQNL